MDAFHPDFEAIERLVTSDIQPAMEFDAGPGSVPIHGPNTTHFIENPSQINYNKGAALVNLMRSLMTEEVFKQACSYYLQNRFLHRTLIILTTCEDCFIFQSVHSRRSRRVV